MRRVEKKVRWRRKKIETTTMTMEKGDFFVLRQFFALFEWIKGKKNCSKFHRLDGYSENFCVVCIFLIKMSYKTFYSRKIIKDEQNECFQIHSQMYVNEWKSDSSKTTKKRIDQNFLRNHRRGMGTWNSSFKSSSILLKETSKFFINFLCCTFIVVICPLSKMKIT